MYFKTYNFNNMSFLNLHTILGRPFRGSIFSPRSSSLQSRKQTPSREIWASTSSLLPPTKTSDMSVQAEIVHLHSLYPPHVTSPSVWARSLQAAVEVSHFLCPHYWHLSWVDYLCSLRWMGTNMWYLDNMWIQA